MAPERDGRRHRGLRFAHDLGCWRMRTSMAAALTGTFASRYGPSVHEGTTDMRMLPSSISSTSVAGGSFTTARRHSVKMPVYLCAASALGTSYAGSPGCVA